MPYDERTHQAVEQEREQERGLEQIGVAADHRGEVEAQAQQDREEAGHARPREGTGNGRDCRHRHAVPSSPRFLRM